MSRLDLQRFHAAREAFGFDVFGAADLAEVLRPITNPMVAARTAENRRSASARYAGREYDNAASVPQRKDDVEAGLRAIARDVAGNWKKQSRVEFVSRGRYRFTR